MRAIFLILVIIGFVCSLYAAEQSSDKWRLVWADEFDYNGLPDAKKWGYDVGGHGWGNKELQYYTERRKENARVENGRLILEARRDAWEGHEYTSARLVSKGKGDWTYGRFEVRAKLPTGRGTWPAIWMLPSHKDYGGWPDGGEIDIMEHVGFDPDVVHASAHTKAYHHSIGTQKTAKINVPTARTGFNTYAVEWTPEEVRAFVNERHYFTFKNERITHSAAGYKEWPFDKPFHLILNIAVGGTWGGKQGVDEKIWPQRMEVEYVRVYQLKPQKDTKAEKQVTKEQKEAARLERRERRLALISYLDGITQKAIALDPPEDRIRILTEVSDAFWFLDKTRATASFTEVFESINTLGSQPDAETSKINSLRQTALARIARRDPELAAKLLSNAPAPVISPADKYSRDLNAEGPPYSEALITTALTLLKTDLPQSVSLARLAMRDGMSQTTRLYLQQLRAIDQATANSLVELSLRQAPARTPGRLFDVLAFWEYAFQPGAFYFGPITWPKGAETRSYEVSQALKLAVLQFAVTAIDQNIQLRLTTSESYRNEANTRLAQLYSVVQQLLPDIAGYSPRAADALRAELGVLEQALRSSGQGIPSLRDFGPSPEETNSAIENLLNRAEKASAGKERDGLYLAAAYRLLFEGQFERAASIASRIDDVEMKNPIIDVINFNWTGSLFSSGKTTEALALAKTISALEPKLVALAKIGAVLATKGDAVVADEILHESQTLAMKATPSMVVSAAVLSIAMSRGGTQRDGARAFEALSLAVSILNKATSDTVPWQMLNPQMTGTSFRVAGLNPVLSTGGGFKSIRVTYPRLAGLTEAFAQASTHDLHQAMRVAQDLNSKPLSLSVQAAVCRSAAERLVQE